MKIIKNLKMCHSIALSAGLRVQNHDRTFGAVFHLKPYGFECFEMHGNAFNLSH